MSKDSFLLEKRLQELSKKAYDRDIVVFSDFLNLDELNTLHILPRTELYTAYALYGGYAQAERRMVAFFNDALCLRIEDIFYPFALLHVKASAEKYAEKLNHRDYLGAILNLGIERSKLGDIISSSDYGAYVFIHTNMLVFVQENLTHIKRSAITCTEMSLHDFHGTPKYEEITGSIASARLDTVLALAFRASRRKLSGFIESGKVFVNGRLVLSNSYQVKEEDIISVRGMGKFQYKGIKNKTKKERFFVSIHKYI
ncbi:MAG: YlmH/Sll1252 family protein [Lachnospiraceae bacterium]|nr:YlmH/Sll1252 family protein [Lachnospiraceae bacterium]